MQEEKKSTRGGRPQSSGSSLTRARGKGKRKEKTGTLRDWEGGTWSPKAISKLEGVGKGGASGSWHLEAGHRKKKEKFARKGKNVTGKACQ